MTKVRQKSIMTLSLGMVLKSNNHSALDITVKSIRYEIKEFNWRNPM